MNLLGICALLCWGSFLNMLAYRLLNPHYIYKQRSFCPHCKTSLAWYDLIPVISWIFLRGSCRTCKKPISLLYPFIEILTVLIGTLLIQMIQPAYWILYGIFFSALIISIRTDLQSMLLSRWATLYLIPIMIAFSFTPLSPLTPMQSIAGAVSGYLFLYCIAQFFYFITKKHGLGQGDIDIIAFIGSCIGIAGWWTSIMLGSFVGSVFGILYILISRSKYSLKIPFGPFLAFGAILYVFLQKPLYLYLYSL